MGRWSTIARFPDPPLSGVRNTGQGYRLGSGAWSQGLRSTDGILIMVHGNQLCIVLGALPVNGRWIWVKVTQGIWIIIPLSSNNVEVRNEDRPRRYIRRLLCHNASLKVEIGEVLVVIPWVILKCTDVFKPLLTFERPKSKSGSAPS